MESEIKESELNLAKTIRKEFTNFIQGFQQGGTHKYKRQAETIVNQGKHTMTINYSDFLNYNTDLASAVFNEYYKYEPHLNQALTEWMHEFLKSINAQ